MKFFKQIILFSSIALIATSCISSNEFQPVENFDIGQPEVNSAPAFKLDEFTIDTRYNKQMYVRTSETTVDYAPYSHWVISPEILLRNFISGAANQQKTVGTLSVKVLAIELRQEDNTAYFVADYTLQTKGTAIVNRIVSTSKLTNFKPELFAKAYREFALKLLTDINSKLAKK
ncbi:MAG: hypothetical protein KAG98_04240 [Lentisphaeria bacterium]|nr:hypothetical protein [Lentisphaeria bacterium]